LRALVASSKFDRILASPSTSQDLPFFFLPQTCLLLLRPSFFSFLACFAAFGGFSHPPGSLVSSGLNRASLHSDVDYLYIGASPRQDSIRFFFCLSFCPAMNAATPCDVPWSERIPFLQGFVSLLPTGYATHFPFPMWLFLCSLSFVLKQFLRTLMLTVSDGSSPGASRLC